MWGMIATWSMAADGVAKGAELLKSGKNAGDATETAIRKVEDFPYYKSVGYGGLPNEEMEVELDAAYMDGDTLSIGAVAAIKDYANPVSIARRLSRETVNNLLVGKERYYKRVQEIREKELKPYSGHDTVGVACLDSQGKMTAATSTSGLFMKKKGRVGDSPIVGSGFYADSKRGAAAATGLGEDLMKGCISYEIVRLMGEGMHPQEACETAVNRLDAELKSRRGQAGDLSLIAMNNKGEWGAATNIQEFTVVVATEEQEPAVYKVIRGEDGHCTFEKTSEEWAED